MKFGSKFGNDGYYYPEADLPDTLTIQTPTGAIIGGKSEMDFGSELTQDYI